MRIELPPVLTLETVAEVRRVMEEAEALAARCAQLEKALESRIVIEQAKGVLVERLRIDPEAAFALLRRGARSNRIRLHELAAAVVSSPVTPPELDGVVRDGNAA
jgi:AmiR/NasT family two-component response regulator